jgi:hypothetical protein
MKTTQRNNRRLKACKQATKQQSTTIFTILCEANSERFPLIRGNVEDKRVKKQNYIPPPPHSGLDPE